MAWSLRKRFTFEAAHRLPHHDGKCARLHGHSWVGELEVAGAALSTTGSQAGMLTDFADLKAAVAPLLDTVLDHHDLNATTGLMNPTSEELARWVFDQLVPTLPNLVAVTIHETCTSACRYAPRR